MSRTDRAGVFAADLIAAGETPSRPIAWRGGVNRLALVHALALLGYRLVRVAPRGWLRFYAEPR